MDRKRRRLAQPDDPGDLEFLERVFHKLMLNFTWWVNRKDAEGRNVFQGGFLGLDNIGVFDRSAPLPTGGYINQSDGTSWMAMYSLNLMRIALELAQHNHVYEDIATKFFEHFLHIAEAMTNDRRRHGAVERRGRLLLRRAQSAGRPDAAAQGAVDGRADPAVRGGDARAGAAARRCRRSRERLDWFLNYRPDLAALVSRWNEPGKGERRLLSLLRGSRMKKLLRRMLDETEFLSDYGVRALSRHHREHPYTLEWNDQRFSVDYQPGESDVGAVRRQLELARADLDAGQLPDHRVAAEVPPLLRRRFQGRVPDRVRPLSHDRRGRGRTGDASDPASSCATSEASGPCSATTVACRTTRTSAITCCSTSTSTATPDVASARRTRPDGPAWSRSCCSRDIVRLNARRRTLKPSMDRPWP